MGRRGPPPKPRAIKLLQGTFRKDRAPKDIPKPPKLEKVAKPPAWLGKKAQAEWKRIGPWLESQGLLTKVDQAAFASYCDLYATIQEYRKLCRDVGPAVAIQQGYRKVLATAMTQMKQYLALFGLSPADRERIGVEPQQAPPTGSDEDGSPEEQVFGRSRRA